MPFALKIRTLTRPIQQTYITRSTIRMSSGQSHASGQSAVPQKAQEAVPKDIEQALPDSVHPTATGPGQSTNKTHALNDGEDSIVPKKIQEILPESVERAVPNAIHNTGDKK
ncbi:hypothetical protein P153DRAFT_435605 [Dothidotthia symphoricarpi CBS 119687]|uniref:Uncharacterized protein n=1 Tax=Dothidotthia symphoricarpi CBS 119687 TaxID=1392245 RepID=A0A6A6A079_9PLEO|nr:uncharacterized protein P153DRAFT_435605 [Dothidotthia symphoricarpi CBS 119687]KAF2123991.1 hypothetical protein P153DRAFT_435605 [Dothidotthia symphoricarpi CBS 119687]